MPSGTVSFMDGSTLLGKAALVKGVAKLSISKRSKRKHRMTAVYDGGPNFSKSTSAVVTVTVSRAASPQRLRGRATGIVPVPED